MSESTVISDGATWASGSASVPCFYCSVDIPAESFLPWSTTPRLISASCHSCGRRVTLTTDSLQELVGLPQMMAP